MVASNYKPFKEVAVCYLDSIPRGVTFRDPISIAKAIPGASRSITSFVA